MLTIVAFVNFIGSLFNCTFCIYIFSLLDEITYKPEKSNEFSDIMKNYYPLEMTIHSIITISALLYGNWLQLALCAPVFVYNLYYYFTKQHMVYYAIGEAKINNVPISNRYKIKFVYYLILSFFNLIKLIISATNMLSYNMFGDTNFFGHMIKLIGYY